MHWQDLQEERPEGRWLGLELFVEPGDASQRPPFHMQAASRGFLRLMVKSSPLLWARVDQDYRGYTYLRNNRAFSVLDPLTAAVARAAEAEMGSARFRSYWVREFAARLMASPVSPLHPGRWWLLPTRGVAGEAGWKQVYPRGSPKMLPPACRLDEIPAQESLDHSSWDRNDELPPLALRPLSAADDDRVKAWRRSFREQALPPVLMLWMNGLRRLVILDGHDRLMAALAEGGMPEVMILALMKEDPAAPDARRQQAIAAEVAGQLASDRPRLTVESANQLLGEAFDDRLRLSFGSRGWPLAGGVQPWSAEVRRHLAEGASLELTAALLDGA